jgi:hypothetical protein
MNYDIQPTDVSCNCPWMACPHHPGALCSGKAGVTHFEGCSDDHWLGDGTLGPDIHLCQKCGEAILNFFSEDILKLMQDLTEHVPEWMEPLEAMTRVAYKTAMANAGWVNPQRDAAAVLTLAHIVCIVEPAVPKPIVDRITAHLDRLNDLTQAFHMSGKETGVHE